MNHIERNTLFFVDTEGNERSGVVWRELTTDANTMYLGNGSDEEAEAPMMYWVVNSEGERWTVRDGRGVRGFVTAYGVDFYSDEYVILHSLKKIMETGAMQALETIHDLGCTIDPVTWALSGASPDLSSMWEKIIHA